MFRVLFACAGALLAVQSWAAGPQNRFVAPVLTVRKLSAALVRSAGSAEKAVWSQPVPVSHFVGYKGDGLPTQKTELRVAYDNSNLYFAFLCRESEMDKLTAKHNTRDEFTWRDDSVSIILSPGNNPERFFHFIGSVNGSQYDERDKAGGGILWNARWTIKLARQPNAWRALVIIPFAELGTAPPKPGEVWGANFYRTEVPHSEKSYFSPPVESFQDPTRWGRMVFAGEKSTLAAASLDDIKAPGTYPVTVSVSNPARSSLKLSLQVFSGDRLLSKTIFSAKPGQSTTRLPVQFPIEGRHHVSAAVVDASTSRTICRTGQLTLRIPENRRRIETYTKLLREPSAATGEAGERTSKWLAVLEGFSRLAAEARGNAGKWAELARKLDESELEIRELRFLCADTKGIGYSVGTESALRKVMRDKLFEGRFDQPARISACRNEFEAAQLVIGSSGKPLRSVVVSASELAGPNGAVIPAHRVQLNIVDFVKTLKPRYEIDYIGWYPDPLLENRPFDVDARAVQPLWVTVHVPTGIPAGLYKGSVTIRPDNAPETTVPLEVTVWDFDMPVKHTFRTAFALFPHEIGAWWDGISDDVRRAQYKFLLDHRISPTNIYTPKPLPEKADIPYCVEHGMNSICLVYTHNKDEKNRAELARMVEDYRSFLKERGWWDMAYLYGFDEILPEKYPELRDMYGWVKRTFPDLPRMCTVIPNPELKGCVDIWVPVTSNWKQDVAEQYVKDGDQVWWYVCCNPHHPYANFFIDYPAIDPRIIFWQCWKYRIPGFLYYALNIWERNRSLKSRSADARPLRDWDLSNDVNANGDGLLIYPGPEGRFLSSIRFEAIRDGIEDWECFNILDGLVKKAESGGRCDPKLLAEAKKVLAVREEVVKSVTEYTLDPDVLLRARTEVAEMIEKLSR